jgi:hypothetical protein
MERTTEPLSTRDLASPNEQTRGVTTSERDAQDAKTPEADPRRNDQAAPAGQGTRPSVDEETPVRANEQTRLPAEEQTSPSVQAEPGGPAGDQIVDARQPDAEPGTQSGVPADEAVDGPANATHAVVRQDQDTDAAPASADAEASVSAPDGSLLPADMDATFQERWKEIQTRFVDEPRGAVEDADGLVANLMQQLAEGFAAERERLEAQWGRGEDISTEDLRVALQRYRSFFQRLLST